MWVSMSKAQVSLPVFQSLEAFWPGVLVILYYSSVIELNGVGVAGANR